MMKMMYELSGDVFFLLQVPSWV